jgi:nucleotide-binding universal stress UspA family protein
VELGLDAQTEEDKRLPVVVAIDGETASDHALQWAFDEAVMRGTELRVIHVLRPGAPAAELERRQVNVAEVLAGWRADYPDLVVWADIARGDPTLILIGWSRCAAVLVVGHPHTLSLAPWSRSLARTLIASCACPLVVVPSAARTSGRHHEQQLTSSLTALG